MISRAWTLKDGEMRMRTERFISLGSGSIQMSQKTQEVADEPQMNSTMAMQLSFSEALASLMDIEKDVLYFEDDEDAKWTNGDCITITDETFESGRREIWMHEAFLHLVDGEAGGHNTKFKSIMDENADAYHELIVDIGKNSISGVLEELGFSPERYTE